MYLPSLTDEELIDYLRYKDPDGAVVELLKRLENSLDREFDLTKELEETIEDLDGVLNELHELQRED